MKEFLKFGRFKREFVKIHWGQWPSPAPLLPMPMDCNWAAPQIARRDKGPQQREEHRFPSLCRHSYHLLCNFLGYVLEHYSFPAIRTSNVQNCYKTMSPRLIFWNQCMLTAAKKDLLPSNQESLVTVFMNTCATVVVGMLVAQLKGFRIA